MASGTFRFHDSLTRATREFVPQEPGVVRMYHCGPTVYSYQHVGNYRPYTCWDVLRRSLELAGYRVEQVVNITDVGHLTVDDVADAVGEDKLELASRREKLRAYDVARKYTDYFFDVGRKLNWKPAHHFPRATAHVPEMVAHVEELIRRGHAYATPAGNVYFDVASFPGYGKLSGNTLDDLVAGARVEVLEEKRHPADFALWKRDDQHQMQWDSPWGRGFPGWHIECSVMARKYLGDTLDIHTGGEDHLFPHHECEIAQSEGVTGKPFARYWLHNRFILIDGRRMGKSLGNMYVLADVERQFGAEDHPEKAKDVHRGLRYFLLSAHYRAPVNLTWEAVGAAIETVRSLDAMARRVEASPGAADEPSVAAACAAVDDAFLAALQDDLNVSAALAAVHEFRSAMNRVRAFSAADAERAWRSIERFDSVLGLGLRDASRPQQLADAEVARLIDERQAARKAKDFARADALRKELLARGIVLEDTPQGVQWRRA